MIMFDTLMEMIVLHNLSFLKEDIDTSIKLHDYYYNELMLISTNIHQSIDTYHIVYFLARVFCQKTEQKVKKCKVWQDMYIEAVKQR